MAINLIIIISLYLITSSKANIRIRYQNSQMVFHIDTSEILPWDTSDLLNTLNSQDVDLLTKNSNSTTNHALVIPIDSSYASFDPCNAETFTYSSITPLLISIENSTGINIMESGWVALIDFYTVASSCNGSVPPIHLRYESLINLAAQKLGAKGVLLIKNKASGIEKFMQPPGVNTEAREVNGRKIKIPLIFVNQNMKMIRKASQNTLPSSTITGETTHPPQEWWMLELPILVPFDSENKFNVALQKYGIYRLLWTLLILASICLLLIILKQISKVFKFYSNKTDMNSRVAFVMRSLVLIPEVISGLVKIPAGIDPFGVFHVIDYFTARHLMTLISMLGTFTDVIVVMYCFDIYSVFKASIQMKKIEPLLLRRRFLSVLVILFPLVMVIVDQIILYNVLRGVLGVFTNISILHLACTNLFVVTAFFVIAQKMKTQIKIMEAKVKTPKDSTVTSYRKTNLTSEGNILRTLSKTTRRTSSKTVPAEAILSSSTGTLQKISKILEMRKYLLCSAVSRLVTILTFIGVGLGLHESSGMLYCFILGSMGISNVVCSAAQTMAALQLGNYRNNSNRFSSTKLRSRRKLKSSTANGSTSMELTINRKHRTKVEPE